MNDTTSAMISGIQTLLIKMRERNDDLSIAEVTLLLRSGLLIENITSVTSMEGRIVVLSDGNCKCHHIKPEEIAGYSHVKFD